MAIDLTPYRPKAKPALPVITVRLTTELHAKLKAIAHDQRVSLNVLCLAALESAVRELERQQ